jgi:glycosyltransferase involved in cell wall biosynthesis
MKRRSTLYHLDGERGFRGGERQLLYLAASLRAHGRRNVVYCRPGNELEAEAAGQGFEVRPLSTFGLIRDARREGAVVHAHTGRTANFAVWARLASIPFVCHRRVDFPVGFVASHWKYGLALKTIAVSSAIAQILKGAGLPESSISVIPDGLPVTAEESAWTQTDAARFRPAHAERREEYRKLLRAEFRLEKDRVLIGNLAALVPHKDHDNLLAAAVIVLLKRPHAVFLIAGRGPEEARLRGDIERMGLSGKVILMGHRADPLPLLKGLDLYVQSSWGEGMGSVLIEAAACGVPIAATTAGGIPEVVESGVSGQLVRPRDPEALAQAIVELIDDRARAARFAAEGLKRLPRFGLTRMAADMEKIYDSIP